MIELTKTQKKFKEKWMNPLNFSIYFLINVPMVWISGMKLVEFSEKKCISFLPFRWYYRWQNMNPFKSMYFAVQCMGAEISTASLCALSVKGINPSIAFIVTKMNSKYFKKATGNITFTCEGGEEVFEAVNKAIKTKKGVEVDLKTIGTMSDGTIVSEFCFTWSFKQRDK